MGCATSTPAAPASSASAGGAAADSSSPRPPRSPQSPAVGEPSPRSPSSPRRPGSPRGARGPPSPAAGGPRGAPGGAQELLPADEPNTERQWLLATASGTLLLPKRRWREVYFPTWRRAFMYHHNPWFGECLEISFRLAVWLLLFSIPIIWGTDEDPLWVDGSELSRSVFSTGACLCAVYTTAPTIGRTLRNAFGGLAGTFTAAAYSLVMYLVYPDGCSGVTSFAPCYVFGVLAGAASIWLCLLLQLGVNFKIFYCSNFVWFWMAFLDPSSPMRTDPDSPIGEWAPDSPKWGVMGLEFPDWGGGVLGGVMSMISGAFLAFIATLLPYPMASLGKARDSAFETVRVLTKTWENSVAVYVAEDRDDKAQAKMLRSMSDMKDHVCTLQDQLDATSWEMCFLWHCGRSWRLTHAYMTELEATTARCLDRLSHVVSACRHEGFDSVHYEFVKPERCGNAVRALVRSANDLFSLAMKCVEDGSVGKDEKEELLSAAHGVGEDVATVTRQMKRAIAELNEMELGKRLTGKDPEKLRRTATAESVFQDTAEELNDEQIFMFSLCDFADRVQRYSRWLAEQNNPPSWQARDLFGWVWNEGFWEIFNKDAIMNRDNLNATLRHSLSIFAAFAVGYVGYSQVVPARGAIIPSTVSVLLTEATSAPVAKSLGRLQGAVVGKFAGLLAYAMLGWCASWAQASLSVVVFSYVFFTLFVYNYTSPFSYFGMLAAAFGTNRFLVGCSAEVVGAGQLAGHATDLVGMLIAVTLMTVVDCILHSGLPSDLAYAAYLDAWKMWHNALEQLLLTGEDVQLDLERITAAINRAEALAGEASSSESRLWKPPFPGDVFSEMIDLARTMRIQVKCILTCVCDGAVVYGRGKHDGTASFSKKPWFKDLLRDENSGWQEEIEEVFEEMNSALDTVRDVAAQNGQILSIDRRPGRQQRSKTRRRTKFGRGEDSDDEGTVTLVESKMTQSSFVYGSLQTIKSANHNMQLAVLQKGVVS